MIAKIYESKHDYINSQMWYQNILNVEKNNTDALILPFSIKYDTLEICVDTPIFGNRLRIRGYRNSGSSPCTDIAITVQYTKTTD